MKVNQPIKNVLKNKDFRSGFGIGAIYLWGFISGAINPDWVFIFSFAITVWVVLLIALSVDIYRRESRIDGRSEIHITSFHPKGSDGVESKITVESDDPAVLTGSLYQLLNRVYDLDPQSSSAANMMHSMDVLKKIEEQNPGAPTFKGGLN